ncbi:hypothetical protein PTKIN_Ptkin07bG0255200 [Pterospermum kingtungense]
MAGLQTSGCRKTQIWSIQGGDAREIIFSPRRYAFFEKASELCSLCALETVFIVFFPIDRPCYGLLVINRLVNSGNPGFDAIHHAEDEQEATLHRLIKECTDQIEKLKKIQVDILVHIITESLRQIERLVDGPHELTQEEFLTLISRVDVFMARLRMHMQELPVESAAPTIISAGDSNVSVGGSSQSDPSADPHDPRVGHDH